MELVHKGEFKKFATGTHKVEIYKVGTVYMLFVDDYFRAKHVSTNGEEAIQSLKDFVDRKYADANVLTQNHISYFIKINSGYETIIKSAFDEYLKNDRIGLYEHEKMIARDAITFCLAKFIKEVKI